MKKKIWVFWFGVIFCCVMLAVNASAAAWDGTAASGFAGGSGTENDPYQIDTAEQLAYLAVTVNSGTTYEGKYIKLTADIVLNDTTAENWLLAAKMWIPIGTYTDNRINAPFSGTFDGGSHSISGLFISTQTGTSWSYKGLFGYTHNAILKNVMLTNAYIAGEDYVGALVGAAKYYAENTSVSEALTGCVVKDSYINGESYVGGLFGSVYGFAEGYSGQQGSIILTIERCHSEDCFVQGELYVGGITGVYQSSGIGNIQNHVSVAECTNSRKVSSTADYSYTGGVVGYTNGDLLTDCINSGTISSFAPADASSYYYSYAGGISGKCSSYTTFINCSNYGEVSSYASSTSSASPYSYAGGIVGVCDEYIAFEKCKNYGYISSCSEGSTSHSDSDPYSYAGGITGFCESYTEFIDCINSGKIFSDSNYFSYTSGIAGFCSAFSTFTNCMNTGGISSSSGYSYDGGIAGSCKSDATFTYCVNSGGFSPSSRYASYVGGIVTSIGSNSTIKNCYNNGSMTVSPDIQNSYVGGIVGKAVSIVGEVSTTSTICNCFNTGTFYGYENVGGIVGYIHGIDNVKYASSIRNCYNLGDINGLQKSKYTPASYIGAIAGQISNKVRVDTCYYLEGCASDDLGNIQNGFGSEDCSVPTADIAGTTVSCADAQLQQQSTYVGFDFDEIWSMGNADYPYPVFRKANAVVPVITKQPSSITCCVDEDTNMFVSASVSDDGILSYQWYISDNADTDGQAIDGAISSEYTPHTESVGTKYYYAIITNTLGESTASVKSNVVAVEVKYIIGDVNSNGLVDWEDGLILTQYFAGYDIGSEFVNPEAADVDDNGILTRHDAMILARYLASWNGYETLPLELN